MRLERLCGRLGRVLPPCSGLKLESASEVLAFWQSRPKSPLRDRVLDLLTLPTSTGAVERVFSLAGLVDVKNRQAMGEELRETATMLLCNGDLEGRWTDQ